MMEVRVFPQESFPLIIWIAKIAVLVFWFMIGLQIMAAGMSSLLDFRMWIIFGKYWLFGTFYASIIRIPWFMSDEVSIRDALLGGAIAVGMTLWYYWKESFPIDELGEKMLVNGVYGGITFQSLLLFMNNVVVVRPVEEKNPADKSRKN